MESSGIFWEADTRLTNNVSISKYSSVSVSDSTVNVVWCDSRDGNNEVYYKRNPSGNVTGIENIDSEIPQNYGLDQNYPNPFNPSTTINFSVPSSEFVTLKVFDVIGNEVAALVNEEKSTGSYEVEFNASELFQRNLFLYD